MIMELMRVAKKLQYRIIVIQLYSVLVPRVEMKDLYTHLFNQSRVKMDTFTKLIKVSKILLPLDDWAIQRFINQPLYSIDKISVIFRTDQNQTNKTTLEKIEQNWLFQNHLKKVLIQKK